MTTVKYLNHSSVLIQDGESFLMTDPWFQKPAFGSWLPVPPLSVPPSYLVALAKTIGSKFSILISHGHDDHLDDEFLALFPKDLQIAIPKFEAKGLVARLKRSGFENILEIADREEQRVGPFVLTSYFNLEHSRDDAITSVQTSDALIIHANDNWKNLTEYNRQHMASIVARKGRSRALYMSQCNVADGFPYIYEQFSEEEKLLVANRRITTMSKSSLQNAQDVGCGYFMNYAGHTKAFVKDAEYLEKLSGYKEYSFFEKLKLDSRFNVDVLDLVPGDEFNFDKITKMFAGVRLIDSDLKDASVAFYKSEGVLESCSSFQEAEVKLDAEKLALLVDKFLKEFYEFCRLRTQRHGFRADVMKQEFTLSCDEVCLSETINLANGAIERPSAQAQRTELKVSINVLTKLLLGSVNLEELTIGGACSVLKFPIDYYNGDLHFWLSMYAYYYQRLMGKL